MRKNQLVPPASVLDLEKGAHQHKALNDERVLPVLYACPMIYLASPARDLGQGGAAINILFAQRLTLSLPLRGAALPWRHQGIGIKKARRKSRPSDCTAGEMFQRGSGDWKQYRSMFDLSKCDEIDLHFGERDRSVPYHEVMAEVDGHHRRWSQRSTKEGPILRDVHSWQIDITSRQDNCTFTGPKFYAFEGGNLTH